ncbi:MAG TPA: EamA family transporter, partial [Microthrixaceae bacterium]|nr:EamA family transporter [Microthrixaceae bacterium]
AVMASLLGRVGATRGSIVTYLMPPVSIVLGVLVRNDHIAWLSVVGMAVVLAGAVLVSRKEVPAALETEIVVEGT